MMVRVSLYDVASTTYEYHHVPNPTLAFISWRQRFLKCNDTLSIIYLERPAMLL
jgi:hypothetical protein